MVSQSLATGRFSLTLSGFRRQAIFLSKTPKGGHARSNNVKAWLLLRARRREILGMLVVSLAGLLSLIPFHLREQSLDCLFVLRNAIFAGRPQAPREVVVVFMNDSIVGDWTPYVEILKRFEQLKVKAVIFDFVFVDNRWARDFTDFDEAVTRAVAHGVKIVFAAEAIQYQNSGVESFSVFPGIAELATRLGPSVAIGIADLRPDKRDSVVRVYRTRATAGRDRLAIASAKFITNYSRGSSDHFWINYYGPPGSLTNFTSDELLNSAETLRPTFEQKVVFVGQGSAITDEPGLTDRYKTPLSPTGTSSGVEIHATAFANAIGNQWIEDLSKLGEGSLVLLVGLVSGICFVRWTPRRALIIAAVGALLISTSALLLFQFANRFFPWLVIAGIQMLAAFAVSFIPLQSAFISYRAAGSSDKVAFLIADGLRNRGIDVYLDVQSDQAGYLQNVILREVENSTTLILIAAPELVENGWIPGNVDWVGEEIARALFQHKVILPVCIDEGRTRIKTILASGIRPVYEAHHSPERFELEKVLGGQIFETYQVKHHDSSIEQIAGKLKWGLRTSSRKTTAQLLNATALRS